MILNIISGLSFLIKVATADSEKTSSKAKVIEVKKDNTLNLLYDSGQYQDVISLIEDKEKKYGLSALDHFRLHLCYKHTEKSEKSMQHLLKAAKMDGQNKLYNYLLGQYYEQHEDYQKAGKHYLLSAKYDNDPSKKYARAGDCYHKDRDYKKAYKSYKKAMQSSRNEDEEAHYRLLAEDLRYN